MMASPEPSLFEQWCQKQRLPALIESIKINARHFVDYDEARKGFAGVNHDRALPDDDPLAPGIDPDLLVPFGLSNTFAITGPRGSGKSTLLNTLPSHFASRDRIATSQQSRRARPGAGQHPSEPLRVYTVSRLLDCTVLPDELAEPGAAVLSHLCRALVRDRLIKPDLARRLNELIGTYHHVGRTYRDLSADLASTPEDFGRLIAEGINGRLSLADRLHTMLGEIVAAIAHDTIIILLDDFDLVPGPAVRRWNHALLDELRQPRLLFVLTADFHRLGHLSSDEDQQIDDRTGLRLVAKLLPTQNRLAIEPLSPNARRAFKPLSSLASTVGSLDEGAQKRLGEVLDAVIIGQAPYRRDLISALLPTLPRGALDLYTTLQQRGGSVPQLDMLLVWIADCRNEPLFARALLERADDVWLSELDPVVDDPPVESWGRSVEDACHRAKRSGALRAIELLRPRRRPREEERELYRIRWLDDLARPPDWRTPLRHDEQYRAVLRDANVDDHPIWCELLIDRLIAEGGAGRPTNRVRFSERWHPVGRRYQQAAFRVKGLSRAELRQFVTHPLHPIEAADDGALVDTRALLRWLALAEPSAPSAMLELGRSEPPPDQADMPLVVQIGWPSLFDSLRGARPAIPYKLLARIGTGPDHLDRPGAAARAVPDPDSAARLLPGAVWAMVLFADALQRVPWDELSVATRLWQPLTYIGLAAAFVRTAYLYAIRSIGGLTGDLDPTGLQSTLLTQLDERSAYPVIGWSADDIHRGLASLFTATAIHPGTPARTGGPGSAIQPSESSDLVEGDRSAGAPPESESADRPHPDDLRPLIDALRTFESLPAWTELARVPWPLL